MSYQKTTYRTVLFVLFFTCFGNLLTGSPLLDSLRLAAYKAVDYQERSTLYKKIGDKFYEVNQDSIIKYYDKSLEAAQQSSSPKDDIVILRSFAHLYGNRKNDYATAKSYLEKALKIAIEKKSKVDLAIVKNDLGVMAKKEGDVHTAIDCFFEAYKIIQQEQDDDVKMRILLSLGVIHNETSYNEKAKIYYQEALVLAKKTGHHKMKGLLLNNLGKINRDLGSYLQAKQYFEEALSVFDSINSVYWKGLVLYNFGNNHFLQKEYETAISYYEQSVELNKISQEKDREVLLMASLAEVYGTLAQHQRAIQYALQGLELLKEIETTEYYVKLHAILGQCYQQAGDYEKSSYYLQQHIQYKQLRKEEDQSSKIGQLQAMHENELKLAAVKQLELKIVAEEAKQQKTTLFLRLLLISFILAIALFGLLFYRNKLKQAEKNYQLRNKLARDLHDNIGSSLNQIKIMLGRFSRKGQNDQSEIKTVQSLSNTIIANMYDLIWSIDKEKEKTEDLLEYMRDHASNVLSPLKIPLSIKVKNGEKNKTISSEVKNNIYSIYKEAVNNIVKHTRPKDVAIRISVSNNTLNLFMQNDKQELVAARRAVGHGLANMKKRAALINGQLNIMDQKDQFIIDLTVKLLT